MNKDTKNFIKIIAIVIIIIAIIIAFMIYLYYKKKNLLKVLIIPNQVTIFL